MIELDELQQYIYSVFTEFDRICKKHGLKYSMEGGTLMGAVKFRGFVPWDDDIDVVMLRDDYETFLKIAPTELDDQYFLQSFNNIPQFPLNYAKLCYNGTMICDYAYSHIKKMNHGVFMDIFPLDNVVPKKLSLHCSLVGVLTGARVTKLKMKATDNRLKKVVYKLLSFLPMRLLIKMINKVCTHYNTKETGYIYEVCNSNRKFQPMKSEMYHEYTQLKFRDADFMAVKEYDSFLKSRFGEHYAEEMPPDEERICSHHETVVFTNQKE
ncbi:MAG: LicD family protein [Clostridia bacterium]|nr:LicD family protein [Clostridia bacterium]